MMGCLGIGIVVKPPIRKGFILWQNDFCWQNCSHIDLYLQIAFRHLCAPPKFDLSPLLVSSLDNSYSVQTPFLLYWLLCHPSLRDKPTPLTVTPTAEFTVDRSH